MKQLLASAKTGEPVAKEDIVKDYEFAKDQYVLFTNEELEALEQQPTHNIDIAEFLPAGKVDRIYLDRVYYLDSDKGGARVSAACPSPRDTGRAALAQCAARGRQYLVLVRPNDDGLVMEQLRYANEIRSFSKVQIGGAAVKKEELALATRLIEQAQSDAFHPREIQRPGARTHARVDPAQGRRRRHRHLGDRGEPRAQNYRYAGGLESQPCGQLARGRTEA